MGDRSDAKLVSTPKIIRHPSPVTVQLNSKAELECVADGAAVYDWYKDDKFLKSTGRANGRLVFDKAAVSDAGTYYCVAVGDKGGKTTSKTAKFTVGMCVLQHNNTITYILTFSTLKVCSLL